MTNNLAALATLAISGTALSQSSVTLYGVADAAITKTNNGGELMLSSSSGLNNGTSRWGVRGVEDLGGGLKASFNFEAGFSLNDGAGNLSGGQLFSRAANLGLSGGFGSLLLGRALTPSFRGVAAYELTDTANYSALASQFNFAGAGSRNSSQIAYTTPNFGGITASIGTILKGNDASSAPGLQNKVDMNVIYKGGPLSAGFSYNKTKSAEKNWAMGASYDLGMAKVAASYQDPAGASKGFTIGASAPLGPVTLTFDIARVTSGVKETDYVLESKYAMSKRTFAYAVLVRDGLTKTNGLGIGLRHNF